MAVSTLEDISEARFTDETIRRMYRLVDKAKTDPEFQKLIYGVVNRAMPRQWKNYRSEVAAILNWAKRTVDYRRDPFGVELLQDVWATLDRRRADCDDYSILIAAAVEVLGSPARFVTVSTNPAKDASHVYVQACVGGRWESLDAIVPNSFVGWEPPNVFNKRPWGRRDVGLSGGDETDLEGLGMISLNNRGFYRTDRQSPSYATMAGMGEFDLGSILQTVGTIAGAVVSGVKSGTVTNVQSGISSAVDAYAAQQQLLLQQQQLAAQNAAAAAAIALKQQEEAAAKAAALNADTARREAAMGGMPGWVLPVAVGAGGLVLIAMFAKGRK